MDIKEVLSKVDHTLLSQNATWNEAIEKHHEIIKMIENEDINLIKKQIQDAKNK